MQWQPISTAPKDGTEVLTYRKAGLQAVAAWWPATDCWCVSDGMDIIDVTHWILLPEPPK